VTAPRIPIHDETAPIACTLAPEEIPGRVATIERMRASLHRLERIEHGLLLHFPPDPDLEAALRDFAVDEKRCCRFRGFGVVAADSALTLRWDGPANARDLIDRLEVFFAGDGPLTLLDGLL
jgi:hypothetical protein